MYRGFDLTIQGIKMSEAVEYNLTSDAKKNFSANKEIVRTQLKEYLLPNGSLDGKRLQEDWFPQIESDVFISHSHDDLEIALFISGVLEALGLKVFIDSTVWGYSDELLRIIDEKMCPSQNQKGNYNYQARNYSTAHVHMMLSVALNKMIDKSECLFFLNTPSSVSTKSVIEQRTRSPWIYSEIANSRLLRVRKPDRMLTKSFSKGGKIEALSMIVENIEHVLELDHLQQINQEDIVNWLDKINEEEHILDTLYKYVDSKELLS